MISRARQDVSTRLGPQGPGRSSDRLRSVAVGAGKGEPIPEHPYPGQDWKEVRHDNTVTWLAFWKDSISQKDYKYVWLAANSTFKSDSDLAKYEKARKLKVRTLPPSPLPRAARCARR